MESIIGYGRLFIGVAALFIWGSFAKAQDTVRGGTEPIVSTIDPSKLTCDILVDGNLAQDDPASHKFKTLQAAYAAAPAGTEQKPTVIGIKPNVYQLPSSAPRTPSLRITKNYITLLGLTNNRRAVVLADNRGLQQGAEDDGFILDVRATGFTAKNLTIVNYCNTDYDYPGDPGKNLKKRSDVITQAVALQAAGDKHVYENVALLGRLDTMFLQTTRSYFKNVYIEGTDDWLGGGQISVWEDCTLVYPTGSGVMSATNVVFRHCRFEAAREMEFYKAEFGSADRPIALIDCILPAFPGSSAQGRVSWIRGKAPLHPRIYSLTYHNQDADGHPAAIADSDLGAAAYTYSRELSDAEVRAFNPWNLLRAVPNGNAIADDWDPADARKQYETAGEGNLVYRIAMTIGAANIRAGGPASTIAATIFPRRVAGTPISWSTKSGHVSLSQTSGQKVGVTASNHTDDAQWVPITATAPNGFYATAYVYVEPKYIDPPGVTSSPKISAPSNGEVGVAYALDLAGREDRSLVTWSICDDAAGTNAREVALSRGDRPLKTLALMPGFAGHYLKVAIQPKHKISEPGPAVSAVSASPIAPSDVPTPNVSVNFRNFVPTPIDSYTSGLWTILGPWTIVAADELVNGYGLRSGNAPASLLYQEDAARGDMQVDLVMTLDKTAGQGFSVPGSPSEAGPRNLHSDVYIKYDPRTGNGYALRFWRTTQSASKCMFQLYKIANGVGAPIDDRQELSGVLRPSTKLWLKMIGNRLSAGASNDATSETLHLEATVTPNQYGGAGIFWPGGSANVYSRFDISYPAQHPPTGAAAQIDGAPAQGE